jgi:hypothetical protein
MLLCCFWELLDGTAAAPRYLCAACGLGHILRNSLKFPHFFATPKAPRVNNLQYSVHGVPQCSPTRSHFQALKTEIFGAYLISKAGYFYSMTLGASGGRRWHIHLHSCSDMKTGFKNYEMRQHAKSFLRWQRSALS